MKINLWQIFNLTVVAGVFLIAIRTFSTSRALLLGVALAVGALAIIDSIFLRIAKKNLMHMLQVILPAFFMIGLFGTTAGISSLFLRICLGLLAAGLFYSYQIYLGEPLPAFLEDLFVLSTAFLLSIFLWSLNFFYSPPAWGTLLLSSVLFFPVFFQSFYKLEKGRGRAILLALVAILLISESAWVILFLPLHFLTAAVMQFGVFYTIYMLSLAHFSGRLTRKKVYFHVGLILIVLGISLLSSPWQPII